MKQAGLNSKVSITKDFFQNSLFNFQGPARDIRGYSSAGRAPALQAGGRGFESLYFHHQQHAASCGCLWACIVLLLIRSTVICAELLNYDHEDECLVRAAWTSDLHRASSSRKNAVPSGETGCGIGEAHTLVSHPKEQPPRGG